MDQRAFFSVPTDGMHSLDLKANAVAVNTPKNFAGQVGSVNLAQIAGDYNHNGAVDAADYVLWRDSLNSTTQLAADGSSNGVVDVADYGIWRTAFGAGSGASLGSAIPEPNSLFGILAIAATAVARCRRRRSL